MTQDDDDRQSCGMSCAECFRLGNARADWPRRTECKQLDARLLSSWENEGGIIPELDEAEAAPRPACRPEADSCDPARTCLVVDELAPV